MCNGAAGKGNMRLRSGKNYLPSGSVLSRLHERLHAIARKNQHGAQAANLLAPRLISTLRNLDRPRRREAAGGLSAAFLGFADHSGLMTGLSI
jgi:hypothetical protein